MKKIIYILILSVLLTINCFAQNEWQRTIGGSNGEIAYSVAGTMDGGCVCIGYTNSFGAGYQDAYVVKFDAAGTLQWTKTFGGPYNDYSFSIIQTSDTGYILTATFNTAGFYVLKLNSIGALQWCVNITGADAGNSIIQTSDGGYAIGCFSYNVSTKEDFCIIKLSSAGAIQWNKVIGGDSTDICESIIQTTDGGYALSGITTSFGNGLEDIYVVKLNASGEFQWNCTVGGTSSDITGSIVQSADGGYAAAGSTLSYGGGGLGEMYIIKLNANGTLQWTRTAGSPGSYFDGGESVIQTRDGGYVVSGFYQSYADMYIVKFSSFGFEEWAKTIGGTDDECAYSITKALDGGYFLAGYSDSFNGNQRDMYVVKLDSNWATCGNSNTASSIYSAGGIWGNPNSNFYSTSLSTSNFTPSVSSGGTVIPVCSAGILYSVSGTVRYQDNNQPVSSGYVKALRYDEQTQNIITVDSTGIQSNGTYMLIHCPPIPVDIMAYENDEDNANYVPTYYVSTIYWENATNVTPDTNLTGIDIGVYRINNSAGNMHIGGTVYNAGIEDMAVLKDAVIYARIGNVFKGYSKTGYPGTYRIDSLSSGTYELIANRMGFYSAVRPFVLITFSPDTIDFVLNNLLVSIESNGQIIPEKFWLSQNYPNPFNPQTKIKFGLPEQSFTKLIVYDVLGREVGVLVNEELKAGEYNVEWNASMLASGIYFYRLETNKYVETRKMILIK